ncbi:MAG: hypothetical protein MUE58_10390 [Chitinophagaceae bacterium]|nr:hypothetical protein [Chitinophagaceae bacterium]
MYRILLFLLYFLALSQASLAAVDTTRKKVDIRRAKIHDDIDKLQNGLLSQRGTESEWIQAVPDPDINLLLTDLYTRQLDIVQDTLEQSTSLDHRLKVKYLTGLENLLKGYQEGWIRRSFPPEKGAILFPAYLDMMQADARGQSIAPIVDKYPYETGNILVNNTNSVFFDNPGFQEARTNLFRRYCGMYPDQILPKLENYTQVPFADSLISVAAYRDPGQFYDYAAAVRTRVGQLIRRSSDPLVRAITQMASSKRGRLYFPFLDEVMHGRQTIVSLNEAMADSIRYYRLLVQTEISHADRLRMRDTPLVASELPRMLKRRAEEVFINQINALHDAPDAVRFKILEPLNPQELYYLIVLGEEIIYTSSYKGVYNRMMERMPGQAGDSLLMSVRFDRFKKFIKMAAGYNTLDHFLGTMPDSSAQRLMIAFARGLDKTGGLEEAVDVADSYGSINAASVKRLIDREIEASRDASQARQDKRSFAIYDILQTIFASSADSAVDISSKLGIPPVYTLDYSSLADASGRVVQLVFFYGDKDGIDSYGNFMGMFNGKPDWSVNRTKEWVEIKSVKGRPVWIYANLPLDNSKGDDPDAKAQEHLISFLESKGLQPSVVIHRGHSYHVKYTLRQLPASARIVILGSCGGYHNLDDVLRKCPDAHIISSKEVGTRTVNEPILRSINEDLRNGRNVNWVTMWKGLSAQFPGGEARERFENYIPPHKNLGALFIKAYQRKMGQ